MDKFNLSSLLNSTSLSEVNTNINRLKVIPISVHDLMPSRDNFYSIEDIQGLKDSIEMFGIKQNLTVKELDNGKYRVIAGHRRCLASQSLVEEGKQEYEMIPCVVETVDSIKEEILLITTNATTRQLSDWEKTQQAQRLRELLEKYRKQEKVTGRTREIIAQILEISPTQIGRMGSISKNLTEDFTEEFKKENIGISTAYELSTIPPEAQEQVFGEYQESGSLTIQDVKEVKAQLKEESKDIEQTKQEQDISNEILQCEEVEEYKKSVQEEEKIPEPINISEQIFPTIYEVMGDMSKQELAEFISKRCDGSGFCDFYAECRHSSIADRSKICLKWLDMQVQEVQ